MFFLISSLSVVIRYTSLLGLSASSLHKSTTNRSAPPDDKEYDISTFDDLYLYYSSQDSTDYGYINYKLYNKSEETTEE